MHAIMNPPYSLKYDKTKIKLKDAPTPQHPDLLFVLEALEKAETGVFLLPHGTLFRSNKEAEIRRQLVDSGHLEALISLPPKLFIATDIPTVIWVIDSTKRHDGVFIIQAEKEFEKEGPKNRLITDQILQVYEHRQEVDKFSRLVPLEEIQANDYNLNIPRYIQNWEPEPPVDLDAVEAELKEVNQAIEKTQAELADMLDDLHAADSDTARRLAQVKRLLTEQPRPYMPRLDFPQVKLTDTGLPTKADQDLVAGVAEALDGFTDSELARIEALKEIKREMLEKMFP